ncbi:T9SS type A sorting domain-containing protein [Psychroserpens sp.]|uniref:T9SS type A sorting domain-containing protein n=1 Tax=Psychroserpens sp. TaxID=2020870 RepID=UPI00385A914D
MKKITFFHEHLINTCLVSKTKLFYVLLVICSYSNAQISTNGMQARYEFNDGATLEDTSNSGVDFTQTGTNLIEINDRFGAAPTSAISLNGDYLTRPDLVINGSNPFSPAFNLSYSFWLKTSTNSTDTKTIIDDSTRDTAIGFDSNDSGYYIYYRDGKVGLSSRFVVTNPGFQPSAIGYGHVHPTVISDGNWHHVVVEFRTTNNQVFSKIYIDEVLDSHSITTAQITTSPNTTGNLTIANSRFNHLPIASRYTDIIDDILIYNRLFSISEVSALANYNNYCFTPSSSLMTVSGITDTTANIDFNTNGDVYDIAYHKSSEPFINATLISNISNATGSSRVNLSNLDVFTDYDVYLRKQCVNNPGWSDSITFTTTQPNPRLYVNENAIGANDGTSWANAYTNLQDALAVAAQSDDVWVAKGTYKPSASNRAISFVINTNVYGGFVGNESSLSDRDMNLIHSTNETILSGDLANDDDNTVDFNDSTRDDNSYHVVEITTNNLTLGGLTIKDGYADQLSGNARFGGGIFKATSVPNFTIKNCVIKNNVAFLGGGLALSSTTTSNIIIDACIIENNLANVAAGLDFHMSANAQNLSISITNSLFNNNRTEDDTVKNRNGGGAAAARLRAFFPGVTLNATITNNTFVNNSSLGNTALATGDFPVIAISRSSGSFGNLTVANNIFWGNVRVNSGIAPAIGKSANTATEFNSVSSTKIVVNNTDEANLSTFGGTTTSTSAVDPILDSNFKLTTGSLAINTGNNNYITTSFDLLGRQRIYDTTVDRGAYEFGTPDPCVITIPDANFKAYLVANSAINTNGDTEIQCTEATAYTGSIVINGYSNPVSDLTGIEAFVNLTELTAFGNSSLTNVDVSSNTALTHLSLSYNALSSLDVSSNTALETLELVDNMLATINVSANSQLIALRVGDNQITAIDVTANLSLLALEANNNQISNLNISTNTNLLDLYLQNNSLISLDVSDNTSLKYLDVSNNNLSSLNVANGNNVNFYDASNGGGSGNPAMDARGNANLSCIQHDPGFTPPNTGLTSSWRWEKDPAASYSINCASLSVDDVELNEIKLYPNPTTSVLNIEISSDLRQVTIYSVLGAEVLKTNSNTIDTTNLKSGMYILKIENQNGMVSIKRFIKN